MTQNEETLIPNVPLDYQYPELPTGCEATALSMLLRWAGVDVDKFEVVDQLKKGDRVHLQNGKWYGANPNEAFVGNPYEDDGSFGVFEQPILQVINIYYPGKAINLTGKEFQDLLTIVQGGTPILVWTTLKQRETYYAQSWEDPHGQTIDWYNNEHAVVIVGYSNDDVIVHDPDTGKCEHYDRDLFIQNWASLGKRAVTLQR
ncbi:C39 family peptidase [Lentibacillus saliphilus]|uniref:C39 family peptidase n=1 Tax=Lentibacillus saliphilus TaxID=2737028 RepID=UPI001C2FC6D2|nr:C39 family peptidase [Lentibacillus saliphilus]